jgi:flavin-dependent dehydrogenase
LTAHSGIREVDVIVSGASLSAAAAAKRLTDAGIETIALERYALPRHKPCSGIISPRGHRFLIENFGPLPGEILHEPTSCRGVTFHFRDMVQMPMDFDHGPTPHLNRMNSDYWAIKQSGVEVHERTRLVGVEEKDKRVEVLARRGGQNVRYRARLVIGADGPNSQVVRSLYPGYRQRITWFTVRQHMHEIIECPLDPGYFHFWFHPGLGYYTWSHERNGRQIVGVGYEAGDELSLRHQRTLEYLERHYGVRLEPAAEREGSVNNFGLSITNQYVFGRGNVIVTGQAAGFLNMIAEGMSCALHSGAVAGEAAIEALCRNADLQSVYRSMIASEVRRCSDQWNPHKIIFGRPHEADFRAAMSALPRRDRYKVILELLRFIYPWGKYNWGRRILMQSLLRGLRGHYSPSGWL